MRLLIVTATADTISDPAGTMLAAPLSRYFEAGTCGPLDVPLQSMIGTDFLEIAAAVGVGVSRNAPTSQAGQGICLLPPVSLANLDHSQWDEWLSEGGRLAVLLATRGDAALVAAWGVVGFGLPSFGWLTSASREDVWTTWLGLAGATRAGPGHNLLQEPEPTLDAAGEATLTHRMRQLYGE